MTYTDPKDKKENKKTTNEVEKQEAVNPQQETPINEDPQEKINQESSTNLERGSNYEEGLGRMD